MAVDVFDRAVVLPGSGDRGRLAGRLEQSFAAEEREGRWLAFRGGTIALVSIAFLLLFVVPIPSVFYYHALLAVFILLSYAQVWLDDTGRFQWWHAYALAAVEFALLAFTLLYPNPFEPAGMPPQLGLRFGNFVYFYVMLARLAFTYQPRLVLWGGAMGALAWTAGTAWLASLPDTVLVPVEGDTVEQAVEGFTQPTFVDLDAWLRDISVFMIIAALLALVVARSRRLVVRQANLERERANLARYFPPATVDRLARQDAALVQVREEHAAVLFADLVGFTRWSERHGPTEVIALLREVHARLAEAVFRHEGTLDKFIGDGMMATFGTPEPGHRDASNALACTVALVGEFEAWNERRVRRGEEPVRLSVGVHYGPVVIGDIGTDRRLELAVLGDSVNVASRLESLTRELGCHAVVSEALVEAAEREADGGEIAGLVDFARRGPQTLRGRAEEVCVLTYA
jgi:adenylate cyclase